MDALARTDALTHADADCETIGSVDALARADRAEAELGMATREVARIPPLLEGMPKAFNAIIRDLREGWEACEVRLQGI